MSLQKVIPRWLDLAEENLIFSGLVKSGFHWRNLQTQKPRDRSFLSASLSLSLLMSTGSCITPGVLVTGTGSWLISSLAGSALRAENTQPRGGPYGTSLVSHVSLLIAVSPESLLFPRHHPSPTAAMIISPFLSEASARAIGEWPLVCGASDERGSRTRKEHIWKIRGGRLIAGSRRNWALKYNRRNFHSANNGREERWFLMITSLNFNYKLGIFLMARLAQSARPLVAREI